MGDGKSAPVIAAIKGKMAGGKYKVAWRTAGNDGHAVSGDYSFTVKLPADIREGGR
jgi:methionine-rich copper-binding protein CopC